MNFTGPTVPTVRWRRSRACASNACVEVAAPGAALVLVRDSKNGEDGPIIAFDRNAWRQFLTLVKV
jgi:hypothetical protein